ncbi:MAG: hypothetical protein ACM3OF_01450 [Gemmatimonas sp.]|jgi:hypothetical protein
MANKPEYVDLIRDATRQKGRQIEVRAVKPVIEEPEEEPQQQRRLSNWPPGRFAQWRLEKLTPWKLKVKAWTFKDWV